MDEYLSLFDYLGKAAGRELGKEVNNEAIKFNVQTKIREVSNQTYKGKIMLYPKSFLETYFNNRQLKTIEL
jgi:hypothetical protein